MPSFMPSGSWELDSDDIPLLVNSAGSVKFVALQHYVVLVQRLCALFRASRFPCLLRFALILQAIAILKLMGSLSGGLADVPVPVKTDLLHFPH